MNVKGFYNSIGGNYDAALSIMMNDMFIERMLGKFFSNNSFNEIIENYEKKDFQSLFAAVHTFKGVTGNLALTPLYELACSITELTRSLTDVNIDKEIDELKVKYSFICGEYSKYSSN